jgi:isoquinoline 1-oxidoreductase alpha subunit
MTRFTVNGKALAVDADPSTRLLCLLREPVGLPGSNGGGGAEHCGACRVHLEGRSAPA